MTRKKLTILELLLVCALFNCALSSGLCQEGEGNPASAELDLSQARLAPTQERRAMAIYKVASSVLRNELGIGSAPRIVLKIGVEHAPLVETRGVKSTINLEKWEETVFAAGVLIAARHQDMSDLQIVAMANKIVKKSNLVVDWRDLKK
jgi:hypothetical protein